jgi:hypothetical protein
MQGDHNKFKGILHLAAIFLLSHGKERKISTVKLEPLMVEKKILLLACEIMYRYKENLSISPFYSCEWTEIVDQFFLPSLQNQQ